ncbi:PAS domain S-box-containing protein [Prosthecobacter debontii]|uniref:histidine kinase n=1 Tax=Prosthecobacter debontii TaxID=48467 RepID=A0A1T4WL63_9BACT|nr:ABC transporter substrate-binding protein [Prosthecobacter debontii]SKA78054.1 PAS domain S-box-containing protein [Prosthecobacter debontii]
MIHEIRSAAECILRWTALCTLVGMGAVTPAAEAESANLKKVTIQLKWHNQFQFAGYYAAESQGYYQQAGLDVQLREGNPSRRSLSSVLAGEADFGVTDCDVLLARLQGKPVVVCAAIFQHSPYILLSLASKGITKPSDLVGKRVMVSTDQGEAEVRSMIMREGLPGGRINFLPHTWNNRDLIEGKVDAISAYSTVEPTQLRLLGHEPSSIRFSDYGVDFYGDTLFTTEALVRRDPALVRAFVQASMKGWEYAMANPEEMVERILIMPGVKERGITREHLTTEAREMVPLIQADLVELGHMNAGRWERIAHAFVETGIVKKVANLDGFMFSSVFAPDLRPLLWGLVVLGVIVGLSTLWTVQLRHEVELRTREVKESQHKLSSILDNTFLLQGLLDAEGRILESNSTSLSFAGVERQAVLGKWFWETAWWAHSTTEQEKLRRAVQQIQQGQDCVRFETAHLDRTGAAHVIDFSMRGVRTEDAKLHYLMVEGYDITDRKRAEDARRVSESNLLALLENSSGAIWSLDSRLRYLAFNTRYQDHILTLGGKKAQTGLRVEEVEPESHLSQWRPHYERALKGERFKATFDQEVRGKARVYQASFNPIRHGGEVTGVSIFCDDVTEQKHMEDQLRQSQKMEAIGQLAGGVAHDFNNLLTVIQGNASLPKIMKMTPEMINRAFNEILDAANRAGSMTSQLLTFSRQQPVNRVSLNLNQVVSDMNRMIQRLIGEHIQVNLRLSPVPPVVHADASMMEQVVLNLAVNARDAMPKGGTLTLTTRLLPLKQTPPQAPVGAEPGTYVCLEVRDTGIGISEEHLERIFEPFFTTKEVGQGTGIGLATVFGIVQQHHGWVTVDSQEGAGSTFCVFFPLLATPVQPTAPEEPAPPKPTTPCSTATILVVEDEATVRNIVKHVLTSHGYQVHEAINGPEALALWPKIRANVDLVLTDMVMPGGMTGHQLAQQLMLQKPEVKVIYTSGYSAETFRRQSVLSDEAVLLRKPYTAAQLLQEVQRLLHEKA